MLLTPHAPPQIKPDVHRGRLLITLAGGDESSLAHLLDACFKAGVMTTFLHYSARCAIYAANIHLFRVVRPNFPSAFVAAAKNLHELEKGNKSCKEVERAAGVKTENHNQP